LNVISYDFCATGIIVSGVFETRYTTTLLLHCSTVRTRRVTARKGKEITARTAWLKQQLQG